MNTVVQIRPTLNVDHSIVTTAEGIQHAELIYYVHFDAAMRGQPEQNTLNMIGLYCYFGYRISAALKSEPMFKLAHKAAETFMLAACASGGKQLMLNNTGREIFRLFNFGLSESLRRLPPNVIGKCYELALQDTLFAVSPDGVEREAMLSAAEAQNRRAAVGRRGRK